MDENRSSYLSKRSEEHASVRFLNNLKLYIGFLNLLASDSQDDKGAVPLKTPFFVAPWNNANDERNYETKFCQRCLFLSYPLQQHESSRGIACPDKSQQCYHPPYMG